MPEKGFDWRAARIASLERAIKNLQKRGGYYAPDLIAQHEAKIKKLKQGIWGKKKVVKCL